MTSTSAPEIDFEDRVVEKWTHPSHEGVWCCVTKAPERAPDAQRVCVELSQLLGKPSVPGRFHGYVWVPEDHPFRAVEDLEPLDSYVECMGRLTYGPTHVEAQTFHGVLRTFTLPERRRTWDDVKGWIGFDTAAEAGASITLDEVRAATTKLALQVASVRKQMEDAIRRLEQVV